MHKLQGKRVLLAEDERLNQELVKALLAHAGIECVIAENGEKALEKLSHENGLFDAVLMDIHMPQMNGLETTRKIRQRGGVFASLPILALTACDQPEETEKALAAGMNGYLHKPIDAQQLFTALAQKLKV
ncbi:MAG: response regulator [Limnobacter sp.]|nr:response regulator [Limnobacter sp.]